MSVLWDDVRAEGYIPLPAPLDDVRLTPYRAGDEEGKMELYNTPSIGCRLYRTPWPYSFQDSTTTLAKALATYPPIFETIKATLPSQTPSTRLPAFPFSAVRQTYPDGTDKMIGTLGLDLEKATEEGKLDKIVIGYVLLPSSGGRGIMTAALKAACEAYENWAVEVECYEAFVETDNPPSLGVMRKCGFKKVDEPFITDWPTDGLKSGGTRTTQRFEREMGGW